uniref:Uncharacterized protein n=1 Tax=Meloidogyne javanica TaxID=6303 RepID=A0A915LNT1_MELJA
MSDFENENPELALIEENSSCGQNSLNQNLLNNIDENEIQQEKASIYDVEMSGSEAKLSENEALMDSNELQIVCTSETNGEEEEIVKSYELPMTEDLFEQCNTSILPYKRKIHPLGPLSSELLKRVRERASISNISKFNSAFHRPCGSLEDEKSKENQRNDSNEIVEWGINSALLESFLAEK